MRVFLALAVGLVPAVAAVLAWRRSRATIDTPRTRGWTVACLAYALAWGCHLAETALWDWTGLSLVATPGRESEALLAMFLFAAPLEEGAKVLSIWPMYTTRRLLFVRHGIVLSAAAAAGFASGEATALVALGSGGALDVLRALIAMPAHLAAAVIWGATLGARARTGWFALAWLAAMLLHGIFDHVVFGRGPGVMVMAAPLLLTLVAMAYLAARRGAARERTGSALALSPSERPLGDGWSEPASVREVWRALQPREQSVSRRIY
jgi:RsiW-degrading membrane proteinase PrsW (M82 family)